MSDRAPWFVALRDYADFYRLRSLLLRVSEHGGRYLSAQDQADAKRYADRLERTESR